MKKSESHGPLSYILYGNESSEGPKFLASILETPRVTHHSGMADHAMEADPAKFWMYLLGGGSDSF